MEVAEPSNPATTAAPTTKQWLAKSMFYPSLLYNYVRHKAKPSTRRWYDRVEGYPVVVGAYPFKSHVTNLKDLGVVAVLGLCGEVPPSSEMFLAAGIKYKALPSTDFIPPPVEVLTEGVEFIRAHAEGGNLVYVHCKAGRGRSVSVVLCYLISMGMDPVDAQALLSKCRPHVDKLLDEVPSVKEFTANLKRSSLKPSNPRQMTGHGTHT